MAKILALALILLLPVSAVGGTFADLIPDVRKLTGDIGTSKTPYTWQDTTILAHIDRAIAEVGILGLAVTVWETITLTDDSLNYPLDRSPIELQTAYRRDQAGGIFGLSLVNVQDYWKTQDQSAYTLIDNQVFVTQRTSEEYQLIVVYTAEPTRWIDTAWNDSTVDIPTPVQPAIAYLAASTLMDATRVELNVNIGNLYRQIASQMITRWLQARRGRPTDSLAIPR